MIINDFTAINKVIILLFICLFCQFKLLWKHHTWSSLMNWARMKLCLSLLDRAVSTSGITLWIGEVLCSTGPSKWQSKPMLPGNWKRLSWGPNGPMVSSGHTVLCAIHRNIKHTSLETPCENTSARANVVISPYVKYAVIKSICKGIAINYYAGR